MAIDLQTIITFATGSLVGAIVTLIAVYFLAKFVLARILAAVATFGIKSIGFLLPGSIVKFLEGVVAASKATEGVKILRFKKR